MFKKRMMSAAAFAAVMATSYSARADDFSSGNYWLPVCQSTVAAQNMLCLAYVRGVWDGITLHEELSKTAPYFCVPKNVTVGQLKDVFLKYLVDTPRNRHLSGDVLVMTSLMQAFPCKQGGSK
ncbi:hypothetical protein YH64_009375 [Achromobacter sp. LC458]|uniref:Rap1a/Tai family immunity protein n=1 Tax=Achromobacter sp. LC458 TaxID=1120623 RepID=UPI00062A099F|nr:Rap1a/Tai family immunity protein [Achromobacter sp. LC458]TRM53299.1 hypothetical protein YH64_009375 [Achromobacter sp. LC458]